MASRPPDASGFPRKRRGRKSPDLPLSSYDPRYKELLLRGARERFSLSGLTRSDATTLRARIHTYRSAAQRHHGDKDRAEWEPLYHCKITLTQDLGSDALYSLNFIPRHEEFADVLSHIIPSPPAKREAQTLPSPTPLPSDAPPHFEGADDLLSQLEREQEAHDSSSFLRGDDEPPSAPSDEGDSSL